VRAEYSHASGQHVRIVARVGWIGGDATDFLGRYNRNSSVTMILRYSY
jgi:hypothetical protein